MKFGGLADAVDCLELTQNARFEYVNIKKEKFPAVSFHKVI